MTVSKWILCGKKKESKGEEEPALPLLILNRWVQILDAKHWLAANKILPNLGDVIPLWLASI